MNLTTLEVLSLVQDGVYSDSGLSGLSVSDDQLTLASSNGHETVDGFKASLHRFVHTLAGNNTGGLDFHTVSLIALHGSLAIDGISEGIEHTTQHFFTDGNVDNSASTTHDVAFLNFTIVTENDDTDVVGFQVERHTSDARGKLHHFTGLDLLEAEHTGNTVTNRNDSTVFFDVVLLGNLGNFLFKCHCGFANSEFFGGEAANDLGAG
jgi:hypothetical protein